MDDRFSEPVDWMAVTLAFAIWAAHFSTLWGASVALPDDPVARWIALAATLVGGGALTWLWHIRSQRGSQAIPRLSYALAGVAMIFGALPALFG